MRKQKVVILNITHGDHPYLDRPPFLPIAAGACRSDITTDADGEDNISEKNKWYGDFTSIYWAWKNLKDVDVIGTSHYRRYLADINFLEPQTCYMLWDDFLKSSYSVTHFVEDLEEVDFVMIRPVEFDCSLKEQYIESHPYPQNLEIVRNVLEELHPEALHVWDQYMAGNKIQLGFLFITKWKTFNELCEWVYPILQRCEELLNLEEFQGYQSRVVAFLYERLVPVFIYTHHKTIKHYPMYFIVESSEQMKEIMVDYKELYKSEQKQLHQIQNSKAYRLGKLLLKPFKWLKR